MPVDGVTHELWPESNRSAALVAVGGSESVDDADGALGDGIQIVIVGRRRDRMYQLLGSELVEVE